MINHLELCERVAALAVVAVATSMRYRQKSPPQLHLLSRSLAAPIADDLERLKDELLALLGLEMRLHFRGERLLHELQRRGAG